MAVRQVLRAMVYSQVDKAARPSNLGSACQAFTKMVWDRSSASASVAHDGHGQVHDLLAIAVHEALEHRMAVPTAQGREQVRVALHGRSMGPESAAGRPNSCLPLPARP